MPHYWWMDKKMWCLYTMDFYSAMKDEILSFTSKWIELENIILREVSQAWRPKIVCSLSYLDCKSRTNTAMRLDFGHMIKGEHIWEVWEKVRNRKHESIWCLHCRVTNTETLTQQRSIWEGDQELEKRSVRDESTWVVTHLYMDAILGHSLYNYPYLN
jgi:hypothetical protein